MKGRSLRVWILAAACLVCVPALLLSLDLPVPMSPFKDTIERRLQESMGLAFRFDGDLYLILGWRPAIELEGIDVRHSDRPEAPPWLRLEYAKVGVAIPPLLQRRLTITEATVRGLQIDRARSAEARSPAEEAGQEPQRRPEPRDSGMEKSRPWGIEVSRFRLRDARIAFGADRGAPFFTLSEVDGSATETEGLKLSVEGACGTAPFTAALDAGSLTTLLAETAPWPLRLSASGAGAELTLEGLWGGGRRKLTGALNVMELDLPSVWGFVHSLDRPGPDGVETVPENPKREAALPDAFSNFEADLRFAADAVTGIPGGIRDVVLRIEAADGRLRLPVSMTALGTRVRGEAVLTRKDEAARLSVDLAAGGTDAGPSRGTAPGVPGNLEHLAFSASAAGTDLHGMIESLGARLEVRNARFGSAENSPESDMPVVVQSAEFTLPPGGEMVGRAMGSLKGEPFALGLTAGGLREVFETHRWPIDLRLAGSGARARVQGALAPLRDDEGPALSVRLSGDRLGSLAGWTGVPAETALPYGLDADFRLTKSEWGVHVNRLSLGDSSGTATVAGITGPGGETRVRVAAHADLLDLRELHSVLLPQEQGPKPVRGAAAESDALRVTEAVLLPENLRLPEMEVSVDVRRLRTGRLVYERCSLRGGVHRDQTTESRLSFDLGESSFSGKALLDLSRPQPELGLQFSAERVDIGEVLAAEGVADWIEAGADRIDIALTTRGRTLSEWAAHRDVSARVRGGRWVLRNEDTGNAFAVRLDHVAFADPSGEPFLLNLQGRVQDRPLTMRWEIQKGGGGDAPEMGNAYRFAAELDDARLTVEGSMTLPLKRRGFPHRLSLSGDRLENLGFLLNATLPPLGAYAVSGTVRFLQDGYSLSDAAVVIGDSRLQGQLHLVTAGSRPRLDAKLVAETLQLGDFRDGAAEGTEASPRPDNRRLPDAAAGAEKPQSRKWFDPATDTGMDADIAIDVSEVLAGADRLGSGEVRIVREKNRLSVAPLRLSIPGGEVKGTLELGRLEEGVGGSLQLEAHRLDYGPLLRLKDPDTTDGGTVSLRVELASEADAVDRLLAGADGRIAFSLHPKSMRAGVLDFWASNLLTALLPVLNPDNASRINCIVADMSMAGGVLTEESLVIDTSKIRVDGKARVDFGKQEVYVKLKPRPKRPQFLSLATPVEVRGSFSDFKTGLAAGGVAGTVIRFLTANVVVPIQWIVLNRLPEDGHDVCEDPGP